MTFDLNIWRAGSTWHNLGQVRRPRSYSRSTFTVTEVKMFLFGYG